MDRFIKKFKRQTPVEEIIAQYGQDGLEGGSSRPAEESTEPTVPRGYKLIKVQQPDGAFITIRRKLATWHAMRQRDTVATTPNHSPRGSTRTVISRTSDGKLVRVERPVRDSTQATPRESMAYLRPGYAPGRMSNRASAVYSEQPNRDSTMTSTMTIIDAALDEQRRSHMERHHSQRSKRQSQRDSQRRSRRHSRGDGSSATAASRIASSGKTSAEIQIGHIEEIEEEDGESFYSSSDYDGYETGYLEDVDDIAYNPRNPAYHSCNLFGVRGFTPEPEPREPEPEPEPEQLPTPLSTVYFSKGSTKSWGFGDEFDPPNRDTYHQPPPPPSPPTRSWVRRVARICSHLLACCSIGFPAVFVLLGIIVMLAKGKPVASNWSVLGTVAQVAAAIWPVIFAAVVAQGFKTWIFVRNDRDRAKNQAGFVPKKPSLFRRLEFMCLLAFVIWCLSPIGSQALLKLLSTMSTGTQEGSINVAYVDQTGSNQIWSPNSNLSQTDRSQMVQLLGEKYISALSTSNTDFGGNASTMLNDLPEFVVSSKASWDKRSVSATGIPLTNNGSNMEFSMTTSYYKFTCGDWRLTRRTFGLGNVTAPTQMSYSTSQTLGMNMWTEDDSSASNSGTVRFSSLNKIWRSSNRTLAMNVTARLSTQAWEYSSIECGYQQLFYNVPVQCRWTNDTGLTACAQSGQPSLLVQHEGLAGAQLENFSQDFTKTGNLPTTGTEPTTTERYIQHGAPVDPDTLITRASDGQLNLSSTVSSSEFAQRFGHLFNTWVSLGYCTECSAFQPLADTNATNIPSTLEPFYRSSTATVTRPGQDVFAINWAWLAVFLVFASLLLIAGVSSVAIESVVAARDNGMRDGAGGRTGEKDAEDLFELQLPRTCSTVNGGIRSTRWAQGVLTDMDAAGGSEYAGGRGAYYA